MKNLSLIAIAIVLLSCSKDDDCQIVTGLEAVQTSTGWKYTIELDRSDPIITNKATTDFYRGRSGMCFEGYK
ncbi:hypothetical protein [Flavobacterium caseinilyticum]|uniref:Uncharacterized protein n=1 Tax=Flavobacterium caseinilyticum TaxID=2541732 RepID=A0A4V6PEQ1_9FLAO|nr:hypothetical protein [Flavobacterium caseinilyticum]TDD77107.1 hypothetical protein E0F89_05780 [Flavobacterium caseinilyticum]